MFRTLTLFRSVSRQINVLPIETIKPASPTPSHLKRYNLSSMDQRAPQAYMPVVFYYPNRMPNSLQDITDKSRRLRSTLSEILVYYYPFAGRLNSRTYVDCNDEVVDFHQVNIKCGLSEILKKPEDEALELVFPAGMVWGNLNNGSSLLVVRLTTFKCGGISIAVCLSHKLVDACSLSTFMTSWTTMMRNNSSSEDVLLFPHFNSYPSSDDAAATMPEYQLMKKHWVTRRLVFPNSKIAQLKAMVEESGLQNTTRVDVLTALLYKCATAVTANSGFFSPTVLVQLVNMRRKMLPPLPETSIGNIFWSSVIATRNESENNLNAIVQKIRKGKTEIGGKKNLDVTNNLPMLRELKKK